MQIGLYLVQQHLTWPELAEQARCADELGFSSAWLFDHFQPIYGDPAGATMEAWTALSALAAITSEIHLGTLVSSVTYRHPSVLAAQIGTLDHISGGRVEIGLGAGWHADEHNALGIDFPPMRERVERLDEALDVIEAILTGGRATYDGRHYTLDSSSYAPRPGRHLPVWVGGTGERYMLPLAGRRADVWHAFGKLAEMTTKSAIVSRCAEEAGRDPAEIIRSASASLEGSPDEIRDRIAMWRDAGFTYLLAGWPQSGRSQLEKVAAEILPELDSA